MPTGPIKDFENAIATRKKRVNDEIRMSYAQHRFPRSMHDQQTLEYGHARPSAQFYQDQCRHLLKDSLRTVGETNEIAQHAAEQLNCQTEQLEHIDRDADDVAHNLDTSQYLIRGMKSWWGSVVQMFTSPPTNSAVRPPGAVDGATRISPSSIPSTALQTSAPENTSKTSSSAYDPEMSQDLDSLSGMLTELHSRAVEMGHTISKHNVKLDTVQDKVDRNAVRMTKQKRDIDQLLKR